MYAIAYKIKPRSSWRMAEIVYDNREKCDAGIAALKRDGYFKVQRVFFDEIE